MTRKEMMQTINDLQDRVNFLEKNYEHLENSYVFATSNLEKTVEDIIQRYTFYVTERRHKNDIIREVKYNLDKAITSYIDKAIGE